jgi:hypothetical protein
MKLDLLASPLGRVFVFILFTDWLDQLLLGGSPFNWVLECCSVLNQVGLSYCSAFLFTMFCFSSAYYKMRASVSQSTLIILS